MPKVGARAKRKGLQFGQGLGTGFKPVKVSPAGDAPKPLPVWEWEDGWGLPEGVAQPPSFPQPASTRTASTDGSRAASVSEGRRQPSAAKRRRADHSDRLRDNVKKTAKSKSGRDGGGGGSGKLGSERRTSTGIGSAVSPKKSASSSRDGAAGRPSSTAKKKRDKAVKRRKTSNGPLTSRKDADGRDVGAEGRGRDAEGGRAARGGGAAKAKGGGLVGGGREANPAMAFSEAGGKAKAKTNAKLKKRLGDNKATSAEAKPGTEKPPVDKKPPKILPTVPAPMPQDSAAVSDGAFAADSVKDSAPGEIPSSTTLARSSHLEEDSVAHPTRPPAAGERPKSPTTKARTPGGDITKKPTFEKTLSTAVETPSKATAKGGGGARTKKTKAHVLSRNLSAVARGASPSGKERAPTIGVTATADKEAKGKGATGKKPAGLSSGAVGKHPDAKADTEVATKKMKKLAAAARSTFVSSGSGNNREGGVTADSATDPGVKATAAGGISTRLAAPACASASNTPAEAEGGPSPAQPGAVDDVASRLAADAAVASMPRDVAPPVRSESQGQASAGRDGSGSDSGGSVHRDRQRQNRTSSRGSGRPRRSDTRDRDERSGNREAGRKRHREGNKVRDGESTSERGRATGSSERPAGGRCRSRERARSGKREIRQRRDRGTTGRARDHGDSRDRRSRSGDRREDRARSPTGARSPTSVRSPPPRKSRSSTRSRERRRRRSWSREDRRRRQDRSRSRSTDRVGERHGEERRRGTRDRDRARDHHRDVSSPRRRRAEDRRGEGEAGGHGRDDGDGGRSASGRGGQGRGRSPTRSVSVDERL